MSTKKALKGQHEARFQEIQKIAEAAMTPHSFKLGLKLNSLTVSSKEVANKIRPSYVKVSSCLTETGLGSKHSKQSFSYIQLNAL